MHHRLAHGSELLRFFLNHGYVMVGGMFGQVLVCHKKDVDPLTVPINIPNEQDIAGNLLRYILTQGGFPEEGFWGGVCEGGSQGGNGEWGDAESSLLIALISHEEEPYMPEETPKIDEEEILAITRWIDLGAPYDQPLIDPNEPLVPWTEEVIDEDARQWWGSQRG